MMVQKGDGSMTGQPSIQHNSTNPNLAVNSADLNDLSHTHKAVGGDGVSPAKAMKKVIFAAETSLDNGMSPGKKRKYSNAPSKEQQQDEF